MRLARGLRVLAIVVACVAHGSWVLDASAQSTAGAENAPPSAAEAPLADPKLDKVPLIIDRLPPAGVGIDEIVVTAQKRAENLQDVPISIAVLSDATIENAGITEFDSLSE